MFLRKYRPLSIVVTAIVLAVFAESPALKAQERDAKRLATSADSDNLLPDEVGERYYIWRDDEKPAIFLPAGWMPDGQGLSQSTSETDKPHGAPHCLRLNCELSAKPWVGVYFLRGGAWEPDEAVNLFKELDAKQGDVIRCRFWARSADRAVVQFKVGGVTKGKVKDSVVFPVPSAWIPLEPGWKMYEIDVTGKNLQSMVGPFMWTCDMQHNKSRDLSFDLDDIYFVKIGAKARNQK